MRHALALAAGLAFTIRPCALPAQPRTSWPTVDQAARRALVASGTPGATVAIVQDGRLVYAQGYGLANVETRQPMRADMLLRVGSVSKMFTGLLLARLADAGRLSLTTPIGQYVPSVASKRVGAVTAQQLMTHTAGWIDNAVAYGRMGEGALGEVMREVGDTLFFTDAGRTFSYSNPGVSMAGYVAEAATKQRFGAMVDTLVLRPAGLVRSTFRPLEALTWPTAMGHTGSRDSMRVVRPLTENTAQWPAGFLFATAPELAQFTIALMNAARESATAVYPVGAVRLLTTGVVAHPGGSGLDSARYGLGLVTGTEVLGGQRQRVWKHGGAITGYNAAVTMLPDRRAAVIVLVNGPGAPIAAMERAALAAIGAARAPEPSPARRPLTASELALLRGTYAMQRTSVRITEENGAAVYQQEGVTMPLHALGEGRYVATPPRGAPVSLFTRVENGAVTFLYVGSRALARQP